MRGDPGLDDVSVRAGWYPREPDSCPVWDAELVLSPTDETPPGLRLTPSPAPSKVGDSIIRLRPRLGAIIPGAGCVGTAPCVAVPGLYFLQWG